MKISNFTTAVRTLTVFPLGRKQSENMSDSLYYYPLIGLMLGIIVFLIIFAFNSLYEQSEPLVLGAVYTVLIVLFTRAFHLDGLGDMLDGFGGAYNKRDILLIMKDSRCGNFGITGICVLLICKTVFASFVLNSDIVSVLWVLMLSRALTAVVCCIGKYAKETGLSYDLVSGAGKKQLVFIIFFMIIGASFFLIYAYFFRNSLYSYSVKLIASLIFSVFNVSMIMIISKRKISGITGDILGAVCEVSYTSALLGMLF